MKLQRTVKVQANKLLSIFNSKDMSNKKSGCSVSLPLVTLILVILKLTGVIDWSWVWVTSPIWIPIALVLFILFVALGVVVILFAMGVDSDKIKEGLNKLKK